MVDPEPIPEEISAYQPLVERLLAFVVTAAVVYLAGRLLVRPAVRGVLRRRNARNETLVDATDRYVHLLVVVLAVFAGVGAAGYGRVVAGSALVVAAITVALGVAGQDVIGNLVSGAFLVSDPEFNVGDYIAWPDGEGVVEAIRFRVTRVRTVNNETVTVPNTELATSQVTSPYGRSVVRLTERVTVAYDDDLAAAQRTLEAAAAEMDLVQSDPSPEAWVVELGDGRVHLQVQYWVRDPRRVTVRRIQSRYARRAVERLLDAGFSVSPPATHAISGRVAVDDGE